MERHVVAMLILAAAGHVVASDPNDSDGEESPDLSDEVEQVLMDLSDDDRQKVGDAVVAVVGMTRLLYGDKEHEAAQLVEQRFLESDGIEWWRCDDWARFIEDDGCGDDGCPVTLAANRKMVLGMVAFAGSESYAQYDVRGLERVWNWCLQDDDSFDCRFVLRAGGDGTYYDFAAGSTATPAGRFRCERFFPPEEASSAFWRAPAIQ